MLPGRYAQWLEITMRYVSSVPVRSTFDPLFNVMLTISMSGFSTVPLLLYSNVRPDTWSPYSGFVKPSIRRESYWETD